MVAEKTAEKAKAILHKRNSVHRQLMQLPINCIITSNYEYSLELSVDKDFLPAKSTKETLYSFYRKQHAAGKMIYHIHGECRYPNSICLGFEHYAGILEKMRGKGTLSRSAVIVIVSVAVIATLLVLFGRIKGGN